MCSEACLRLVRMGSGGFFFLLSTFSSFHFRLGSSFQYPFFFFFSSIAIFRFCWTWSFVPICNFHLIKEDGSSSSSSKKRFIIWKAPVCENYLIPSLFKTPWHTYHIYLFAILCFFLFTKQQNNNNNKNPLRKQFHHLYISLLPRKKISKSLRHTT